MKGTIGFLFFMLFLAAFALVSLQSKQSFETTSFYAVSALTENEWRAVRLFGISVPGELAVNVNFGGDGRLHGNAGCNRYSGRFELDEGVFRVASMRATRRSCDEQVMSLEKSLFEVFRDARQMSLVNEELRFLDVDGEWLATFRSAEPDSKRVASGS